MAKILNTGLDIPTLQICYQLLQQGMHPEALAAIIKELRQEQKTKVVSIIYIYCIYIIHFDTE